MLVLIALRRVDRNHQRSMPGGGMKKLLNVKEAADQLGIGITIFRIHVKEGRIASINIGSGTVKPKFAFRQEDLDDFIASRRKPPNRRDPFSVARSAADKNSASERRDGAIDYVALQAAHREAEEVKLASLRKEGWVKRRHEWINKRTGERWPHTYGPNGFPPSNT